MGQSNCQKAPAQTLAALLTEHPEIDGVTWNIDTAGVIHGAKPDDDGRTIAALARILGGTPVTRSTRNSVGDRLTLTELVTVWHGAHFDVWTTREEYAGGALPLDASAIGGAR